MTVDDQGLARAVRRSFVNELHLDVLEPLVLVDARRPDLDEHAQRAGGNDMHCWNALPSANESTPPTSIVEFPPGPENDKLSMSWDKTSRRRKRSVSTVAWGV